MANSRLIRMIPLAMVGAALLMVAPIQAGNRVEGRWKLDGNMGCYFDANDDGPNQCEPSTGLPQNGRWKVDGAGACYLDPNDSGPDQCSPTGQPAGRWKLDAVGGCYFDSTDSGANQCLPGTN